jgi:hypothetical protein
MVTTADTGIQGLTVPIQEKSREIGLRRRAARWGYRLEKSRTRSPDAIDYGLYALIDEERNFLVNPAIAGRWMHAWTLDDVEHYFATADIKERREALRSGKY